MLCYERHNSAFWSNDVWMRHVFVVCIICTRAFWSNITWVMLVIHQVCLLQTFTKRTARVELSDPRTANNVLFQFRRRSRLEDIFQTFGRQWKWNDISKNMVSRSEISTNMVSKSNFKKISPFCLLNNLQVFFLKSFLKKHYFLAKHLCEHDYICSHWVVNI